MNVWVLLTVHIVTCVVLLHMEVSAYRRYRKRKKTVKKILIGMSNRLAVTRLSGNYKKFFLYGEIFAVSFDSDKRQVMYSNDTGLYSMGRRHRLLKTSGVDGIHGIAVVSRSVYYIASNDIVKFQYSRRYIPVTDKLRAPFGRIAYNKVSKNLYFTYRFAPYWNTIGRLDDKGNVNATYMIALHANGKIYSIATERTYIYFGIRAALYKVNEKSLYYRPILIRRPACIPTDLAIYKKLYIVHYCPQRIHVGRYSLWGRLENEFKIDASCVSPMVY